VIYYFKENKKGNLFKLKTKTYVLFLKMKYDLKKRIFLIQKFYQFGSISVVQRIFWTEYKNESAPSYSVKKNIASTFEKTGSVSHPSPKRIKANSKREEAKTQLKALVLTEPTLSSRKAASAIGVSQSLILSILHDDLHLKPYKLQEWHNLEFHDYDKRVSFAQWFLSLNPSTKFSLICSDEAYFYLTLPINKQNSRKWLQERPNGSIEVPLNDEKVLVWCAISSEGIIGPYFFEDTVNQYNYLKMFQSYFWRRNVQTSNYTKYYFQQDGATAHTSNSVQQWLLEKFSKKFIDKKKWPPRSPDLNPCDYFLWGYLKRVAYDPLPKTLDDLKENICREIKKISKETLKNTFLNFEKRCKLIISAQGGHIL